MQKKGAKSAGLENGEFSKEKKIIACQNSQKAAYAQIRTRVLDYEVRKHKQKMKTLTSMCNTYL